MVYGFYDCYADYFFRYHLYDTRSLKHTIWIKILMDGYKLKF